MLAEVAEDLVRGVLAGHPDERTITLLAILVSNLEKDPIVQMELPLGLDDDRRRPGTKMGAARSVADSAIDKIRDRFGWDVVGYGFVGQGAARSVPDEFRELAEKDL
jgi:DNA polymerase-4